MEWRKALLFSLGQKEAVREVRDELRMRVERLRDGYRDLKRAVGYKTVGGVIYRCCKRPDRVHPEAFKESERAGRWIPYAIQRIPEKYVLASIFLRRENSTETLRIMVPDGSVFSDWIGFSF